MKKKNPSQIIQRFVIPSHLTSLAYRQITVIYK